MNRNVFHILKALLLYYVGEETAASDGILRISNLSQGFCDLPEVCIYGNTTQRTYNECYCLWPNSTDSNCYPLPSGNRYEYHENELFINITDILNGTTQANLLYTVVCVRPICDLPAVKIVTHNFQVMVPNDGMCIVREFKQSTYNFKRD